MSPLSPQRDDARDRSHGRISSIGIVVPGILVLVLILTAVRLAPTYKTFVGTYDEPFHIACGMEWLDKGQYTYHWEQPPLARVAVALGPYLAGLRSHSMENATDDGNAILSSNGKYQHNLMLARLGTLPFLILAFMIIFLWARRWFTVGAGAWAVALFSSCPPVLGHAALATLDVACAATLLAAFYALMLWVERPGWARTLGLAISSAAAFLTKFSTLPFFCCVLRGGIRLLGFSVSPYSCGPTPAGSPARGQDLCLRLRHGRVAVGRVSFLACPPVGPILCSLFV
jgi:hypothetical protein